MTDDLEQDLLREAQGGDMTAYEDLQLLLEPEIRRYVRRMVNNPYVEDDIMQDVFIRFYMNMHNIDPVSSLRPYIFRIARNRCYDEFRRYGRTDEMSLDDEPIQMRVSFTEAHRVPKPDDITHWMLLQLEVREAIDNLPETQREALILYSEEQMSYAEIAEIMDCSIGTVKSRLYYAKKNLRGLLRPETVDVLDEEFGNSPSRSNNSSNNNTGSEPQHEEEQKNGKPQLQP
ncbi:RNA polymerase sigma factor [Phototrophicus methaneseepsis]|uniref:RNA polymerase sigma factor n=1 Tax=Phototrophicus methaneseepsis TaxID=2710758 RepID=A0A7S8IFV4_9CHLR|nr:RNA polymerase sigma factor [Phototrophicus methaneseepsis]QPC83879.1 RNA polymerase sigma factor [Phototrophicus methaneseepsis]